MYIVEMVGLIQCEDGEYNPTHHHTNCDLSSIFYLNDYQGDIPRD